MAKVVNSLMERPVALPVMRRVLLGCLLALFASPAWAAPSGIDTTAGNNTLPLSVEGVTGMTLMSLGTNGPVYVGVGNASPGYPLDVSGNIRITGDAYLGYGGTWLSGWLNQNVTNGASPVFGNVYLNYGGTWLSSWLNQAVTYGSGPTFGNIYLNYGPGWLSSWLNQSVAWGASPTFGMVYTSNGAYMQGDGNVYMTWCGCFYNQWMYWSSSDQRLKKDIQPLSEDDGLAAIEKLRPVTYYWKDKTNHQAQDDRQHYGLIAQEVAQVFPAMVMRSKEKTPTAPDGVLRIETFAMFAPLIKAVQELKALFDTDHNEIAALRETNRAQAQALSDLTQKFDAYQKAHP